MPPVVVDRVQRHFMEDLGTVCPFVQILDLPVPQMVDNVLDALRRLDLPIAEQVIDVPKISCSPCPSRCPIPEPQSAEQLVEVPTVLSPTRIALRIAEQIVDTPVPRGRGQGCVHGFLQEQSTTATPSAEERISERIVEQFSPSSVKRTSERIEEQIVFLLQVVAWDTGLPHLLVLQMRILLGVFRTFPRGKKSARASASPSAELPREVSSWTPAAYGETIGADEWVQFSQKGKPFYWNRRSHETSPPEGVKVVWVGEQPASGGFGTGTRKRVSVLMTSHRFLLADWSRGEGLGIPSPLHGCHTRRRQRRHVQGWCCWSLPLRAVLLPVGARPRCLTSRSVWTRRTVVQCTGFAGGYSPRSMFPSVDDRP